MWLFRLQNVLSVEDSPMSSRYVARAVLTMLTVASVSLLDACMMFARPPKDLDYGRVRVSEAGLYRGTIRPDGDSIPKGKLQKWTLHLESPAGACVDTAKITIDG